MLGSFVLLPSVCSREDGLGLSEEQAALFARAKLPSQSGSRPESVGGRAGGSHDAESDLAALEETMHNRNQCEVDEVAALQQAIEAKELLLRERKAASEDLERRLN